jgi:hypothetical protein
MADDFKEYILQHILRGVRADEAADVVVKDSLQSPQQLFKRFTVSGLGAKNQMRLMNAVVQEITFH